MPWRPGHSPVTLAPEYERYLFEQWTLGAFDDYWKQPGIYAEGFWDVWPDAPMVHMSSWFDPYPRTATDNYIGLRDRKRGPVRLILGPWTHGDRSLTWAGDVDFGAEATLDGQLADRLLGAAGPLVRPLAPRRRQRRRRRAGGALLRHGWRERSDATRPGVWTTEVAGAPRPTGRSRRPWTPRSTSTRRRITLDDVHSRRPDEDFDAGLPVRSGRPGAQHRRDDHVGSADHGRRRLRPAGAGRTSSARPSRTVRSPSGRTCSSSRPSPSRRTWRSPGPLVARLWISSDCPDTDFTAKLIDVYPPNEDYPEGFAMNLTDGIIRCRYRDSWESAGTDGAGSRVRGHDRGLPDEQPLRGRAPDPVDVSSSNYPHFDINFNTGESRRAWRPKPEDRDEYGVDGSGSALPRDSPIVPVARS